MTSLLLRIRTWSVQLGFAVGSRRPIRRRVLFATSHADALCGNLAMLREELRRRTPTVETLALVRGRGRAGIPTRAAALWQAVVSGYRLATCRVVVVDDYFFPIYVIRPRRGTTIIQVWHASGAFKKFGYSVANKTFGADARLLRQVRIHSNYDVCLVSSMSVAPHYAEAFGQPLDRFRADLGIPRTDALFGEERISEVAAALRHRYAIPPDKRVILYAPTFRGESVGVARADGLPDWRVLRDALAHDHVLLVRLHPFVRVGLVIDRELDGFLTDVSDHPEITDLLHVADVLVTDYSSVIFEYALLGKPMVFFAPDLAAYERERGFYLEYRTDVPGPVVETTVELAAALRDPPDIERVRVFAQESFDVADGAATARVVDEILLPALRR